MKGQVWALDFAVSVIIFAFVSGMLIFAWNYATINSMDQVNLNIIENDVIMISDSLVRAKGVPLNWNKTNVNAIGLAEEENVLNKTKLIQFLEMDYDLLKSVMGIGNYDFYFGLKYINGTVVEDYGVIEPDAAVFAVQNPADFESIDLLDNFVNWDFYWGNEEDAPPNQARRVYDNGKSDEVFDILLSNLTNYNTTILEDPHGAELNDAAERAMLFNFVNDGGTYIHIQHQDRLLQDAFGIVNDGNGDEGIVVALDPILKEDTQLGSHIVFEQKGPSFPIAGQPYPTTAIMEDADDPTQCVVCRWSVGEGLIYYLVDLNDEFSNGIKLLNIGGTVYDAGVYPTQNASMAVPIERYVLLEGKILKMEFIIWT